MLQLSPLTLKTISAVATNAIRGQPDFSIDGFPEYASDVGALDNAHRQIFTIAAQRIAMSQESTAPVMAALIVGNADKAWKVEAAARPQFELQVSQRRAKAAGEALMAELLKVSGGVHYARVFRHIDIGIGNGRPKYANAVNEQQMRANRRVDIFLCQLPVGTPDCNVH
jgi:outer membrane protein OmpA-like peptidoglycan-associated protein